MSFINWCVMLIPVIGILGLAVYSRKYVRGVADYLAAGRVAGRYVISVGDLSTMLGVITIIALVEQQYQCGFRAEFLEPYHHADLNRDLIDRLLSLPFPRNESDVDGAVP